jgi:hypothetical protein
MSSAASMRKLRAKHKKLKRCLWCPKRAQKGKSLCRTCGRKHVISRRQDYKLRERDPAAMRYKCSFCGELGHNARRHKS